MRFVRRLKGPLLILLLVLLPASALADGIVITTEPNGEAGPIHLTMPADQQTATFSLYVHNTSSEAFENLVLFAFLEDANGQTLPEVDLDFLKPEDEQPLGSFSVLADAQARVLLRVDKLTHSGTFTGTIALQHTKTFTEPAEIQPSSGVSPTLNVRTETTLEILAHFTVERPGQAKIVVQEADSDGLIALTASTPDFQFPLTLTEVNDQIDVGDLEITLGALTRKDGAAGSPAAINWSSQGDEPGPLLLTRHSYRTLALSGTLPEATTYKGWLSLNYGNQLDHYILNITRAAPPGLTVLEATNEGKVELTVRSQQFERTITLQIPKGQPAVDDLKVSLSDPERQDGNAPGDASITCSVCDLSSQALEPGKPLSIVLIGKDLETTTYVSTLRLYYRGQPQTIPLAITRAQLSANLDVGKPKTVLSINWPWFKPATADVKVIVREKAGQKTQIYYPSADSLELTDKDGNKFSVSGERLQLLHQEPSGELTLVPALSATDTVKPTLSLAANDGATYVYRIGGLKKAGTYSGQIKVFGPDSTTVTQDFTIIVKDAWIYAFIVLSLGVAASYGVHYWTRVGRSRILRGADIAQVQMGVQRLYDASPSDPVWKHLLNQLQQLQIRNRYEKDLTKEKVTEALNHIRARKDYNIKALDARDLANRLLDEYPPELQAKKREYQQQLGKAFQDIQSQLCQTDSQGLGAEQVPKKYAELLDLIKQIKATAVEEPAKDLEKQLDDLIQEVQRDGLAPELEVRANEIKRATESILNAIGGGQLDGLAGQLETAREQYLSLRLQQLDELLQRLEQEQKAASYVPGEAWEEVNDRRDRAHRHLKQAEAETTIAEALEEWKRGRNEYLGALIAHLTALADPNSCPDDSLKDKWPSILSTQVPDLPDRLRKAQAAWNRRQYPDAERFYQEARNAYRKVLVIVLEHRIETLGALVRERPAFVKPDDWRAILDAELGAKLEQLARAKNGLPPASALPDARRSQYEAARLQFVDAQIQALDTARQQMEAYYNDHKGEGEHADDEKWKVTIPTELGNMRRASGEAKAKWQAYANASDTKAALLEAERTANAAQTQYKASLEIMATGRPMTWATLAQRGIRAIVPVAEALASAPLAEGMASSGPTQALLERQPDDRPFAPLPPAYFYSFVQSRDLLVGAVALVISAIVGLTSLWMGNKPFGGESYITAFLWGFGLHETTNAFVKIAEEMDWLPKAEG
jgi:hypothetical protein